MPTAAKRRIRGLNVIDEPSRRSATVGSIRSGDSDIEGADLAGQDADVVECRGVELCSIVGGDEQPDERGVTESDRGRTDRGPRDTVCRRVARHRVPDTLELEPRVRR